MRKLTVPAALVAVLIVSLACQATSGTPTPGFDALQTMVAATLQAGGGQSTPLPTFAMPTALPTATSIPLTVVPPTSIILPSPTFVPPAAMRIQFLAGATENVTTGTVPAGLSNTYVVGAQQGQALIAEVDSPNPNIKLAIYGANGVVLLPASQGTSNWQGTLPSSQDYYFQVIGTNSTENFSLNIIIAARIQFGAGEIKTTLKGRTVNGYGVTYVAYAQKGQKMDVILTVPGDSAGLTIWGFSDGQPYARAQNGVQDFSLTLPSTQDYIIQVVPKAGGVVDYSMLVRIK
jgi:hypothetical protein